MRILIYLGVGYSLLGNSVVTILVGALCVPRNEQSIYESFQSPRCAKNVHSIGTAAGTLNLIGDIYILLLPVPSILTLQLPKKRKIILVIIFMGGLRYDLCGLLFNPG